MALQVGDPAPLFTLLDSDKNEVSLENFKGENVLLLFYPFAFTGTCTAELCAMRDNLTTYQNLNASVLALSIAYTCDLFATPLIPNTNSS